MSNNLTKAQSLANEANDLYNKTTFIGGAKSTRRHIKKLLYELLFALAVKARSYEIYKNNIDRLRRQLPLLNYDPSAPNDVKYDLTPDDIDEYLTMYNNMSEEEQELHDYLTIGRVCELLGLVSFNISHGEYVEAKGKLLVVMPQIEKIHNDNQRGIYKDMAIKLIDRLILLLSRRAG